MRIADVKWLERVPVTVLPVRRAHTVKIEMADVAEVNHDLDQETVIAGTADRETPVSIEILQRDQEMSVGNIVLTVRVREVDLIARDAIGSLMLRKVEVIAAKAVSDRIHVHRVK